MVTILARFEKPFKTRRFEGFGMPFGHEGRMRMVSYLNSFDIDGV